MIAANASMTIMTTIARRLFRIENTCRCSLTQRVITNRSSESGAPCQAENQCFFASEAKLFPTIIRMLWVFISNDALGGLDETSVPEIEDLLLGSIFGGENYIRMSVTVCISD